jgi:hypothetical protein
VHDDLIAQLMGLAISPPGKVNFEVVAAYRDQFLADAGAPTDPLERVMIEQVATCHAMLMYTHSYHTMCDRVDHREIYSNAGANMMAELRRMVLAIKDYRTSPVRPQVTKIEQQNISHQQEVSYVAPGSRADGVTMACRDNVKPRHKSKKQRKGEVADVATVPSFEAEIRRPRCGGDAEPNLARAAERSGKGAAAPSCN